MTARDAIPAMNIDTSKLLADISAQWDADIIPQLIEYVKIPAKSPGFDRDWAQRGFLDAAIEQARKWVAAQDVAGLTLEVVRIGDRTPVLYFDIPASGGIDANRTVLFYGHLDKQPEMTGWRPELGPWTPVYEDGRLYGRGSADDGYAVFSTLSAIIALDRQGIPRPHCVGLIETCEESGSYDLPAYLDALAPRMGNVQLVVALDSGAGNFEQMWVTTSLRGLVNGTLTVNVLTEGVHSGDAGGVVPSSFRVARQLLDRIDDSRTGTIKPAAFQCAIPAERVAQAHLAANIMGESVWQRFPWDSCCQDGGDGGGKFTFVQPVTKDPVELILNRTWRAALAVIGAAGLPPIESAGNVQRPYTALKLSLRLPPPVDAPAAAAALKQLLEHETPYSARVSFECEQAATGWNAPAQADWLTALLESASQTYYGKPAAYLGEGGTIPFMGMLGVKFPDAQMLVTGVLGPKSNAHGPNEFLHVPYAKKLTAAVAMVLAGMR